MDIIRTSISMDILVILVFLSPEVSTGPLIQISKNMKHFEETGSDDKLALENIRIEQADVDNEIAIEREYRIKVMKLARRILPDFEISVIRCCSSHIDQNVNRCFEVNGFGGVNFVVNPCKYLNSDENKKNKETVFENRNEVGEDPLDNNANINEEPIKVEQKKPLSKYELSIVRCCSSILDMKVGRCFEVNGFGGVHFLKMPCEHFEIVLEKTKRSNSKSKI